LNDLDLVAYLYDDRGHVVASDDDSRDGLNPTLQYRVRPASRMAGTNPVRFTVLFRDRRGSSFSPDAAPIVLDPLEQVYRFSIETTPGTGSRSVAMPRIQSANSSSGDVSLRYTVPNGSESVPLAIRFFDVRGRLVRTLSDSPGAAKRTVIWNRRDGAGRVVGSGVYYAVIEANGSRAVRKLVISK